MKSLTPVLKVLVAIIAAVVTYILITDYIDNRKTNKYKKPAEGKIKNNEYYNEYFELSLRIPDGWKTISQENTRKLEDIGAEIITDNDPKVKEALEVDKEKNLILLMIMKSDFGGASVLIKATDIRAGRDKINDGRDLLRKIIPEMEKMIKSLKHVGSIGATKIDGRRFYYSDFDISVGQVVVRQRIFVRIIKNYALHIHASAGNAGDFREVQDIVGRIQFE